MSDEGPEDTCLTCALSMTPENPKPNAPSDPVRNSGNSLSLTGCVWLSLTFAFLCHRGKRILGKVYTSETVFSYRDPYAVVCTKKAVKRFRTI